MTKSGGKKPTPAALRLVEGTHRADRHGSLKAARDDAEKAVVAFGDVEMPDDFTGEAKAAWDRYVRPCWWIDKSREVTAIVFCELWAELRDDPTSFAASKHVQLRSYMNDLGLTNERMRFGIGRDKTGDPFFDD